MNRFRVLCAIGNNMNILVYGLSSTIALVMSYAQMKDFCLKEDINEVVTMCMINFIVSSATLVLLALRKPVHVVDSHVDLK